jgi:hypothetical protein
VYLQCTYCAPSLAWPGITAFITITITTCLFRSTPSMTLLLLNDWNVLTCEFSHAVSFQIRHFFIQQLCPRRTLSAALFCLEVPLEHLCMYTAILLTPHLPLLVTQTQFCTPEICSKCNITFHPESKFGWSLELLQRVYGAIVWIYLHWNGRALQLCDLYKPMS